MAVYGKKCENLSIHVNTARGLHFPGRAGGGGAGVRNALQFYCPEMDSRWKPGKVFSPRWYQTQSEAEAPTFLGS